MHPFFQGLIDETPGDNGTVMEETMRDACFNQVSFVDGILDSGAVSEREFLSRLGSHLDMSWWDPVKHPLDRSVRRLFSAEIALKHRLLPVAFIDQDAENEDTNAKGGVLHLATCDPFNLLARQAVAATIPHAVVWQMGTRREVVEGLQSLYGLGADTFEKILRGHEISVGDDAEHEISVVDEVEDEEASVVKFVNQIIRRGIEQRATDIHVEPQQDRLRIRYRIDGRLEELPVPENIKALQASVIARLKIMARLDVAERRLPQDGRINLELEGLAIDVRVATIPSVDGESISLRLLGQQTITLDTLGLLPRLRTIVDDLLKQPNGIILITGPTGSGKSTSLYAFLSQLNQSHRRIVTIEDPVEYRVGGIVQIAVKPEIGLTFATGLRSILRGDPNVVMIGEMRDLETTEIAVRAALTGHLVFSTLHTNDSIGGITRLVDMGVEPFLVSSAVRAFFAQRLLRRLCQKCKRPSSKEATELASIWFPDEQSPIKIYEAVGCDSCRGSGYQGRLAIYEACVLSASLRHAINVKAHPAELTRLAIASGFVPMREYGWAKVLEGETTVEEVLSATSAESELGDTAAH